MKTKFKNSEICDIYKNLKAFIDKDIDLPVQFAWNAADNLDEIEKIVKRFETMRDSEIKKLQDKGAFEETEEKNKFKIKPEYAAEWQQLIKKIDELLTIETEVTIKTVSRSDLPDIISAKDIQAVRFMIEDGDN